MYTVLVFKDLETSFNSPHSAQLLFTIHTHIHRILKYTHTHTRMHTHMHTPLHPPPPPPTPTHTLASSSTILTSVNVRLCVHLWVYNDSSRVSLGGHCEVARSRLLIENAVAFAEKRLDLFRSVQPLEDVLDRTVAIGNHCGHGRVATDLWVRMEIDLQCGTVNYNRIYIIL